jgi:hypothetical protein
MMPEKKWKLGILVALALLWLARPCPADEIVFQDQKAPQHGTIVNEDEQTVTIRFTKESIKSITKSQERMSAASPAKVIWEDRGDYVVLKIPRQVIQIESSEAQATTGPSKPVVAAGGEPSGQDRPALPEKRPGNAEPAKVSQATEPLKTETTHEKMLQEEMGGVQGTIMWQGKPLDNGRVRIDLERYTGFSIAAVKRMFGVGKDNSTGQAVSFETQTDAQGRYSFSQVPPGSYRLHWMPDPQTGWVHRLRENPDFEVISGKVISQDIPEKKK